MPLTKLNGFTFNHSDQPNDISNIDPVTVKANFDSRAEEIRLILNNNVDVLNTDFATKEEVNNITLGQLPDGSITEVKLAFEVATQAELNTAQVEIDELKVITTLYNSYSSSVDANGIYTVVEYKRADGTLYMKSTLSNVDVNGNYQTDTWEYYDLLGTTIIQTKVWTFTYDVNGKVISKVVA